VAAIAEFFKGTLNRSLSCEGSHSTSPSAHDLPIFSSIETRQCLKGTTVSLPCENGIYGDESAGRHLNSQDERLNSRS
jgi:hypothetical protein